MPIRPLYRQTTDSNQLFVAGQTWTNMPAAAAFFLSPAAGNQRPVGVYLPGFSQIRFTFLLSTQGAATSRLYLIWSATNADFASYTEIPGSAISLAAIGQKDSGWVNIPAAARQNAKWLTFAGDGGDAAADPVVVSPVYLLR